MLAEVAHRLAANTTPYQISFVSSAWQKTKRPLKRVDTPSVEYNVLCWLIVLLLFLSEVDLLFEPRSPFLFRLAFFPPHRVLFIGEIIFLGKTRLLAEFLVYRFSEARPVVVKRQRPLEFTNAIEMIIFQSLQLPLQVLDIARNSPLLVLQSTILKRDFVQTYWRMVFSFPFFQNHKRRTILLSTIVGT